MAESYYTDINDDVYQYDLQPTPIEALYWATYKVKAADVKIITSTTKLECDRLRNEIMHSINIREL